MPLSDFETQLVTFLDQQYHLTGTLLSAERAYRDYGIPVGKYEAAFKSEDFREELSERGIELSKLGSDVDEWVTHSLTPLQLLVANAILDLTDTRTIKKKVQDLGCSTTQYAAWLRDPAFKNYMRDRAEAMVKDGAHEADMALLDRIRAGDLKAISYYNEMTGRFVPQRSGTSSNIDVVSVVTKIIEIVNEEVSNPQEMLAIANRLKALITARNVAGALVSEEDPIVVPEIAPIRQVEAREPGN